MCSNFTGNVLVWGVLVDKFKMAISLIASTRKIVCDVVMVRHI